MGYKRTDEITIKWMNECLIHVDTGRKANYSHMVY